MKRYISAAIFLILFQALSANYSLNNKISLLMNFFDTASTQRHHLKLNYKPKLDLLVLQKDSWFIDSEITGELYFNSYVNDKKVLERKNLRFYRGWFRYSDNRSELRIGRQKINFGTAHILRSLQWFDRIDPRDPQQNTSGIDALLFRYYFPNNANFWLWTVLADEHLKGIEIIRSEDNSLELGGRLEYPFEYCESAVTFHSRQLDAEFNDKIRENRFGIDSRWDSFLGYWIELSLSFYDKSDLIPELSKNVTVGADYTIPFLDGIYILAEHSLFSISDNGLFSSSSETSATALNLSYNLNIFSGLNSILLYNWDNQDLSAYFSYTLSFDYLDLVFSLFSNPSLLEPNYDQINYDGSSFQLRAIYNFDIY